MTDNFPRHFSYEELIFSDTAERLGIVNIPDAETIRRLRFTAYNMELVRIVLLDNVCSISSGFRCLQLNREIKSGDTSQHILGEAVDFVCRGFGDPLAVCLAIMQSSISYDQLIYEGTWCHISFSMKRARRQAKTAKFAHGEKPAYRSGIG